MGAIWAISVIGTIFILIFGTCCNLSIDIEDKTKYEFLKTNDAEYVVLSKYEDKNLVVEYDGKNPHEPAVKQECYYSFASGPQGKVSRVYKPVNRHTQSYYAYK